MEKLIVLALAFTALVAFASAHTTIVTTTIEDENPSSQKEQHCSHQLQRERFNQCQRYLQQGQSPYDNSRQKQQQQQQGLEQCCQELQNVDEQCQCEAVKQVFQEAQQQTQYQGGHLSGQKIQQLKQKAQNLPNRCNLETRQQCQIGTIITTTTITEDTYENPRRGSQHCSEKIERQRFNQCQRYISQQSASPRTLLMSTDRQEQHHSQQLEQCCNELENVNKECQCEALQEVYRQAKEQQQEEQHQQQQQRSQQRGGQQETEEIRQVVQNLRNKCNLQVEQCLIPSVMF